MRDDAAVIDGVEVIAPTRERFIERMFAMPRTVMYLNAHVFNLWASDARLRRALRSAEVIYCDGAGVELGARMLGQRLGGRLTSADFMDDFVSVCAREGKSVFLLGGRRGVAEEAAGRLRRLHPDLIVAGHHHGYFEKSGRESEAVIDAANRSGCDYLIVGFGSPAQELWVHANRDRIAASTAWCIGAMMDFVSGRVPRAPAWMREHRLEWLYRFMVEPGRMWQRYLVGNAFFLARMLRRRWSLETRRTRCYRRTGILACQRKATDRNVRPPESTTGCSERKPNASRDRLSAA